MIVLDDLKDKVNDRAAHILKELHLDMIDLAVHYRNKVIAITLLTDRPDGGITIDECTKINRKLSNWLDQNDEMRDKYILEVSSPGMDRPLKTKEDFLRVIGRKVRFHFSDPVENKLEYMGIVEKIEEQHVVISTNGKTIDLPLIKIQKAVQVI